ncbi:MAG: hypothetical protein LUE92_17440 [Clostridiales bacterium]|nr:hypothetical protein [Clostridiales bacterium]
MEKKFRHYEFEGVVLDIPMHYDELAQMYIEEYRNFIEDPAWTEDGHPVIGAVEDACTYSEWDEPGRCTDCGSCHYYTPAAADTLIGVCRHEKRGSVK